MRNTASLKTVSNELVYPRQDMKWFIPGFLGWLLLYFIPFVLSLISSFMTDNANATFAWFDNYIIIFRDSYFFLSLKNIVFFLLIVIIFTIILGLTIAQILFVTHRIQGILLFFLLPLFLPAPSIAAIWNVMIGSGSPLAGLLRLYDEQWNFLSLFMLFLWKSIGATAALYLTGMRAINKSIFYAAQVDGANKKALFFRIELPMLRNISAFALLFLLMNGVKIFRESYMLYGAYPPPNLFFVQHYINLSFARLDFGLLSAAGTVFSIFIVCVFSIIWKCLSRGEDDAE